MIPFVTFTKERHRLFRPYDYFTLDEFVRKLHAKHSTKCAISPVEAEAILGALLKKVSLRHFDYVTPRSDTLRQMSAFFVQVKRNGLSVGDFDFRKEKKEDLQRLFSLYEGFLAEHDLADVGDVEAEVLGYVKDHAVRVVADTFEYKGIHFFTSRLQKEIFDALDKELAGITPPVKWADQRLVESFDAFDEAKNGLKIVRELLDAGERVEDILIVASDIDEYFPIFRTLFKEYGLDGYSTVGEPLKHYENTNDPLARAKLEALKEEAALIERRLARHGVVTENLYKRMLEGRRFLPFMGGVEITESNQIFAYGEVKHLIFVGADITHFPPQRARNVFYTKDHEEKFFLNPLFASSKAMYDQMKRIAENLYIIHSRYRGKTKLGLSFIIDRNLDRYMPKLRADVELPKENRRIEIPAAEAFLKAKEDNAMDAYNGIGVGAMTVHTLSASRINAYLGCPRAYFYDRILKAEAPREETAEMEFTTQGTIMHLAFETIVRYVRRYRIEDVEALRKKRERFAKHAYRRILKKEQLPEDIFTKLYYKRLLELIDRFLRYLKEEMGPKEGFQRTYLEKGFYLDADLQPTEDGKKAFIKGFIDRLDVNDNVEIFDYKSKRADKVDRDKTEEVVEARDVQLGLYAYWAKKRFAKEVRAHLITFNLSEENEACHTRFVTLKECDKPKYYYGKPLFACYNEAYETVLKERVRETKEGIERGDFPYDDSDANRCGWCAFETICKRYGQPFEADEEEA